MYFHYTFNGALLPLYIDDIFEVVSDGIKDMQNSSDPQIQKLFDLCRDANADIVCEVNSAQGDTYTFRVPIN